MNIVVVGTGYLGFVTGACLASKGNNVVCVDREVGKLAKLERGAMPICEPRLDKVVQSGVAAQHPRFASNVGINLAPLPPGAPQDLTVIFISVGTPQGWDDSAVLKYDMAVAREIGEELNHPVIIVNKSTVPVGTADTVRGEVAWQLFKRKVCLDFEIASDPEFLKEGNALQDIFASDRIVIGLESTVATSQGTALYRPTTERPEQFLQ